MNKTIIININGTVFHIEEGAYELLKEYMTEVKRHFFNSADSLEITTDIENRIAEMFTELLDRESRQALVEQDVNYVIEQMGTVQDFETFTEDEAGYHAGAYQDKHTNARRRLFRDPDDHLIGGVCAGIASYFDAPTVWIRLAFALAFVFAGTGLFLYIILWIILPKAQTRADRMAMKGEPLDLQGFKKSFEAEMSMVGGRLSDLHHEARPFIYRTRDFVGDFFHHLGTFLGGAGKILVKLFAVAIILGCAAGIVATIVALVAALVFGDKSHFSVPDVFFNYRYIDQVYAAFALVAIIPLAALIILVARAAFNTLSFNRGTGYTLLIVWLFALVVLVYHGTRVASDFRESAGFTQTINLKPVKSQTYRLILNETMYLSPEDSARLDIKNRFKNVTLTDDEDESFEPNRVRIDIEKADVDYPVLVEEFSARGRNYESALTHARNVRYIFTQQDSVLKFDYKLRRPVGEQWHNESVHLTLKLPLNASVIVDDKMSRYINNMLNVYDCNSLNRREGGPAIFTLTDSGMHCKVDTTLAMQPRAQAPAKVDTTLRDTTIADTPVLAAPAKPAPRRR